ncbi:Fe-binding Fe/S cluster assembly protein [Martiniozyma asiatica (nom. inval.)]|nr:Fe-binding Fe/S cluster assembly protein [Martiniozyma asiatica]
MLARSLRQNMRMQMLNTRFIYNSVRTTQVKHSSDFSSSLENTTPAKPRRRWARHLISENMPSEELPKAEAPQSNANLQENLASPTSDTASAPKKRKRRTLKPRKAPITLSANAISHLRALSEGPEPKLIRISVRNRGCSGLSYQLEYVDKPEKFDEVVEQDNVKVVIDSKALFSIIGSEMDWVDTQLSSKFVFKNPNSTGTCGCGESFMI